MSTKDEPRTRLEEQVWLNSVEGEDERVIIYHYFRTLKAISAFILFGSFLAIVIAAIAHDLNGTVYVSFAPIQKNPDAPPGGRTSFDIVFTSRLLFFFFIPLIGALFNIAMIIPKFENWGRAFYLFFLVGAGLRTQMEFNNFYQITPTNPDLNGFGGTNTFDNGLFNKWFKYNLLYGGSGMKHGFNGLASALYAVMTLQIVGVTDLLQLIGGFMFTFLGWLTLGYVEYSYANRLKASYYKKRNKGGMAHEVLGGIKVDTELSPPFETETSLILDTHEDLEKDEKLAAKHRYNKDSEAFGNALEQVEVEWAAYFISVFSILYVFSLVTAYFSFVLNEVGARWYVWVAVVYYMIYNVLSFFLLAAHHSNSLGPLGILTQYWHVEGISLCIHAFAFAFVPLCVIFGAMDTEFLYAISIV